MAESKEIWLCPNCGTQLDISSLGFFAEVTCSHCQHVDHVHTLLANFRLEAVQGVGGMSVVLRGRDVLLSRPVAIKLLNETYREQPERIAKFEAECSMMAKVHHENVVSVYSAGWAKNQFYIAMELLDGRNLESVVTPEHPLKPLRAIDITIQIAKGLEAAHIAGMLHRDMKPGNVIISSDGVAKVLDFGLAQAACSEDSEEVIWATPYYVAPETLQRNPEDARTDIYSLGMTLRYLLTGAEVISGAPSSVSALLESKYHLPPFEREMPKADEAVCDLVNRMTAFSPDERHDNYADLLAELHEVREHLLQRKREAVSPEMRRARFIRQLVASGAIAGAACVSFLVGYLVSLPDAQRYVVPESSVNAELLDVRVNKAVKEAMAAMASKDWDAAILQLESLKSDQAEPTSAAWGILHSAALSFMCKKASEDIDTLIVAFRRALTLPGHDTTATEMRNMLMIASEALDAPHKITEIPDRRVAGIVHCLLVRYYLLQNNVEAARSSIAAAKEEFRLSQTAPYANALLPLLDEVETRYADVFAAASFNQAALHLSRYGFYEATRQLNQILAQAPQNEPEVRVLIEVCTCGSTMLEAIRRVMRQDFCGTENLHQFESLNSQHQYVSETRAREFMALLKLLQRDYTAAFEMDPYKDQPQSNEPFAIMMRDWKSRLSPYIKE